MTGITQPPMLLVARKPCRCIVASTAEHPGIAPAIKRDIAAWERLGFTVERVPRRELHTLPWASLGDGWCLHDPPRPRYGPGVPVPRPRSSVAHEGRRAGRHQPPSAERSDAR